MSDEELDREWKPTGRPQSMMAISFSAALDDLFKMDNSLADLDAAVERKKRAVSSQTSELQALEAQLKATEERLKQRQSMGVAMGLKLDLAASRHRSAYPTEPISTPRAADPDASVSERRPESRRESQHDRRPQSRRESQAERRPESRQESQSDRGSESRRDSRQDLEFRPRATNRPTTSRRPVASYTAPSPRPGALPPTPGASEGEENARTSDEIRSCSSRASETDFVVVNQNGAS